MNVGSVKGKKRADREVSPCPHAKAHCRACISTGNLYGLVLGYWICARGAEAAPLESTTMFMFVLIGNAVTMAILGKALWPEGEKEE